MKETVYITKYALSQGILKVEAEVVSDDGDMISWRPEGKYTLRQYFHGRGRDWHTTLESAMKRAEDMRLRKVASLNKQLHKIATTAIQVVEL